MEKKTTVVLINLYKLSVLSSSFKFGKYFSNMLYISKLTQLRKYKLTNLPPPKQQIHLNLNN